MNSMVINGKVYPLWQQFHGLNTQWVGGCIFDHEYGLSIERPLKEIRLEASGEDSAALVFDIGEESPWFSDVGYIGIGGKGPNGGLMLSRRDGGHFEILNKKDSDELKRRD